MEDKQDLDLPLPSDEDLTRIMRIAAFGMDIEQEVGQSRTLRYLLGQADQERAQAMQVLAGVNPMKPDKIMEQQIIIRAANLLGGWIEAAIVKGREAQKLVADRD